MKQLKLPLLLLGGFLSLHANAKTYDNTIFHLSISHYQNPIKGQIVDQNGFGLADVEIIIKGTSYKTFTDENGFFEFLATNVAQPTLIINSSQHKYVEYSPKDSSQVKVTLQEEANQLNEVIVTALGIKREQKKLGFAQQNIGSEELATAEANNWSSGLKGKVAGLNIISGGNGPINSQQIILRGANSIDQSKNYALIVIDGVPMSTEMTSSGNSTAYMGDDSPIDFGNGISDINQSDIESVTVLKGPAAAALYGNKAANGALIITTKSGKKGKKLGLEYKSTVAIDVINNWPDFQYEYGQGAGKSFDKNGNPYYSYQASEDGPNTGSTSSAFGPKFDGQYFYQYDPNLEKQGLERTLWRPYKDNRKSFWETGFTFSNAVTLSGGDDKGSIRASIGHQKNSWIMPNTGYENYTAAINGNYQVSDRIKVSTALNYTRKTSDNLPGTGYNNGSIAYFMIFQNPNVDLNWYKPIWKNNYDGVKIIRPFSSYMDNPYAIAYEAVNPMSSNQLVGNIRADFKLSNKLSLMLRPAINTYTQLREQKRPFDMNRTPNGYYKRQDISKTETNIDFLMNYTDKWGDFGFSANVGGNRKNYEYRNLTAWVDGLASPGVYKLANGLTSPFARTYDSNLKENSLYGMASFGWKDMIFVDITGRNDWNSSVALKYSSFFYPSVSSSFILSDLFKIKGPVNYLKYRLSFAKVGNGGTTGWTSRYYSQSDFAGSAVVPGRLFNPDIKPESTTSWETGFEALLFKKRLSIDFTLYQQSTKNQIFELPNDITTGYSKRVVNGGEIENRGIELAASYTPIKTNDFSWKMTGTWTKNENTVKSLVEGIEDDQMILGQSGTVYQIAKVGGSSTALYGEKFVRNEAGQIIYDAKTGVPIKNGLNEYVGDATPKWRAGFTNEIKFKTFRFSFTLDGQYGGIVYSQTYHKMMEQGKLADSLPGREDGFIIGDGVVLNPDGTYSQNTTKTDVATYYKEYNRRANVESNSFDASYLKLRDVSLTFDCPKRLLSKTGLEALSLTVYGRDLFTISDFPLYDPETASLNGSTYVPGVEMGQMPSTATYGITLKASL
ncbi:SusC/RagA family TonB-linked outer membrane protein [Empedobacter falsenii]